MKLAMEMKLDYGSTDGKLLEDVASELTNTLKPAFEKNNPFSPGTTTLDVDIQFIDVCASVDDIGNTGTVGEACDPETGSRRKRSIRTTSFEKQPPYQMVQLPVANIEAGFLALDAESTLTSPKAQESLSERIGLSIKELGSQAEPLSDEHLCDNGVKITIPKSLDNRAGYIKQASSSSENFLEVKGIQTKKASSAPKFKLSEWMNSLPENIKYLPLTMIALPGSHQSGTSTLQRRIVAGVQNVTELRNNRGIYHLQYFLNQTFNEWHDYLEVRRFYGKDLHLGQYNRNWIEGHPDNDHKYLEAWSTCQRSSIDDQLNMGVRYFDFR